jgi:hypothetical protein
MLLLTFVSYFILIYFHDSILNYFDHYRLFLITFDNSKVLFVMITNKSNRQNPERKHCKELVCTSDP